MYMPLEDTKQENEIKRDKEIQKMLAMKEKGVQEKKRKEIPGVYVCA